MAHIDENTETTQDSTPASDHIVGVVAFGILGSFFSVVMMMVENGGPQDFIGRGTAYSAGAAVIGAALVLPGIYKKAGPMAFLCAGIATVCTITLAAASFALV